MKVIDGAAFIHKADMGAVVIQTGLRHHGRSDAHMKTFSLMNFFPFMKQGSKVAINYTQKPEK